MRSDDDGVTWSKPVEITDALDEFRSVCDWQVIATGPGHGIQLRNGRLIVPVWMTTYKEDVSLRKGSAVIYSDDGGARWHSGEMAIVGGGESIAAELSDGSVMLSARNGFPGSRRAVVTSPDGATGWSKTEFVDELLEPGCMQCGQLRTHVRADLEDPDGPVEFAEKLAVHLGPRHAEILLVERVHGFRRARVAIRVGPAEVSAPLAALFGSVSHIAPVTAAPECPALRDAAWPPAVSAA